MEQQVVMGAKDFSAGASERITYIHVDSVAIVWLTKTNGINVVTVDSRNASGPE